MSPGLLSESLPTEDEVLGYASTLSNWGRWGPKDELGTLNLVTPAKRLQAAALVKEGRSISCAWPITTDPAPDVTRTALHYMTGSGELFAIGPAAEPWAQQDSGDFIGFAFHGYSITHVDALSHVFMQAKMYNGRSSAAVTVRNGATACSIDLMGDGVVSRAVLLDVARHRGLPWLQPGDAILPPELEEVEKRQGVRVEEGDVLLIRTGHQRYRHEVGPMPPSTGFPGLHAACLPWLYERGAAILGSDAIQDVQPSGYPRFNQPIHRIGIVHMGLWLIDNCNLELVGAQCADLGRWEFMIAIAPLRIQGGTGSPVNPIAIL